MLQYVIVILSFALIFIIFAAIKSYMLENLKLGILGGGQLGSMLVRHGIDLGLSISVMDKDAHAPCARYTSSFICANPASFDDVIQFGKDLDIITIEREAVNIDALRQLAGQGVKVFPAPDTIEIIQDKLAQKQFLESHNIPVMHGEGVNGRQDLYAYQDKLPLCLKKRRNGYDGYGVMMIRNAADIANAFDEPCVLEDLADIDQELSVIVARNEQGEIKTYDPVAMVFDKEKFLLNYQVAPARASGKILSEATKIAEQVAEALQLVGILAVEMFLTKDGHLVVNELAPRPHNSGHHTIEASITSQYEQLLRAILGQPLGDTALLSPSLMMNIIGNSTGELNKPETISRLLGMPGVHLHWYGKKDKRPGRKVGHITITGSGDEHIFSKAKAIREILNQ